jgi:hypothetical protein
MRTRAAARRLSAAALLLAASTVPASAGPATVQADFAGQDPTGCITTEIAVFARAAGAAARLDLAISRVDECRDAVLLGVRAQQVKLPVGALSVKPGLGSATLDAVALPVVDRQSGRRLSLTLRLAWTGEEEAVSTDDRVDEVGLGRFVRGRTHRTLRPATASVEILDGGTSLVTGSATDASIQG